MGSSEFEEGYDDKPAGWEEFLSETIGALEPREPFFVAPETNLGAAIELMNREHIGCVLVIADDKLLGILTERDVLKKVVGKLDVASTRVDAVMTRDPETVRLDSSIVFALSKMHLGGYRRIPVVSAAGKAIGVVSVRDMVRFIVSLCPRSVLNIPPEPELGFARHADGGA